MNKLVLVRHGQSQWNQENRFTGWEDVPLSAVGLEEAVEAGRRLKAAGLLPDRAYTSVLKRAIKTLWVVLEETDRMWIPVTRAWELNERHYGALQGLNKAETAEKHGAEQVHRWRRGYDVQPPPLEPTDPRYQGKDPRYAGQVNVPLTESLKDTLSRVLPYWTQTLLPDFKRGGCALVAAHGNSLRALIKHLDKIDDEQIMELNIPTGVPLVYEFSESYEPIKSYYLE